MTGWFVVLLFTSLYAPSPSESTRLLIWILAGAVSGYIVLHSRMGTEEVVWGLRTALMLYGSSMVGIWLVYQLTGYGTWAVEPDYASSFPRLEGGMLEPNLLAYLILLLLLAYLRLHAFDSWRFHSLAVVLAGVAIFLTLTRIAILLYAMVALVSYARKRPRGFLVGLVLMALAGVLTLAVPSIAQNLSIAIESRTSIEKPWSSGTGASRNQTVEHAIDEIRGERLLVGHGVNAYTQSHYSSISGDGSDYLASWWVALIYDGGLPGALLFITAFFMLVARAGRAGLGFFVSLVVVASLTNPFWFAFPWVLMALFVREGEDEDEVPHTMRGRDGLAHSV
ncbi:O-antigen ligase family protein [Nocardia sp. N13]|uniref:O-antigen ligase family protein n=1 Tax=Nocardioides sp. N13(2025) TaxID=3453405 RepID=UPI003F75D67B